MLARNHMSKFCASQDTREHDGENIWGKGKHLKETCEKVHTGAGTVKAMSGRAAVLAAGLLCSREVHRSHPQDAFLSRALSPPSSALAPRKLL